jgi:hypothetical protein
MPLKKIGRISFLLLLAWTGHPARAQMTQVGASPPIVNITADDPRLQFLGQFDQGWDGSATAVSRQLSFTACERRFG